MAKVYYGTDERDRSWEAYGQLCNALELDLSMYDNMPRNDTLNTWRVESPRGFCFILHADPRVGAELMRLADAEETELSDTLREAWETTLERAEALAAKAVHVFTGSSLAPGDPHRELLATFADELADGADPAVIWEAGGLWSIEDKRDYARELDLVPAFDPFIARREGLEFTHGDVAFPLLERAGMRRKFDVFDFQRLLSWTDGFDRVFTMMRGRHKWTHARELKAALNYDL